MEDITLDDPFAEATAAGEAGSAVRGLTLHWMFLDLAISLHSVFFNTQILLDDIFFLANSFVVIVMSI